MQYRRDPGQRGWATLVNSAKGALLINGQPPVPPPDIPEERLNLPPIPLQLPTPRPAPGSAAAKYPTRHSAPPCPTASGYAHPATRIACASVGSTGRDPATATRRRSAAGDPITRGHTAWPRRARTGRLAG